jgi:hypothetical protein
MGAGSGVLLVNGSRAPTSRLVFPRLSLGAARIWPGQSHLADAWRPLLEEAARIRAVEATASFDALREDIGRLADKPENLAFIEAVDRAWLATIPLVAEGWAEFRAD